MATEMLITEIRVLGSGGHTVIGHVVHTQA